MFAIVVLHLGTVHQAMWTRTCLKDACTYLRMHMHTQTRAAEINEKAVHTGLKLHEIDMFINIHVSPMSSGASE